MLNIGGAELLIILLVALIFLGPQRLPDVARQLGQTVSSLRSLASGFQAELEAAAKPDQSKSMTLDGPTDQADAIAATQTETLKEAAQNMDPFSGEGKAVSAGGPKDLRRIDPKDRYLGALGDPGTSAASADSEDEEE